MTDVEPIISAVSINNPMVILLVKKLVLPKLMLSTPTTFQPTNAPFMLLAHATLHPVLTKTTMTPKETAIFKKNSEAVLHSKKRINVTRPVSSLKVQKSIMNTASTLVLATTATLNVIKNEENVTCVKASETIQVFHRELVPKTAGILMPWLNLTNSLLNVRMTIHIASRKLQQNGSLEDNRLQS